jgi:hypothetical protein
MILPYAHILMTVALLTLSISHTHAAQEGTVQSDRTGAAEVPVAAQPSATGRAEENMVVENIPPLYKQPKLPREGIWIKEDISEGRDVTDPVYRTVYRPGEKSPNAVVYMFLFNMKYLSPRLFPGTAEPRGNKPAPRLRDTPLSQVVAVTNALWQTAHAGKGGIILRGEVIKKLAPDVATIVFYNDESVDILQWNDQIPIENIRDARQLKHLIVNHGKVVTSLVKHGKPVSAEIGLGSLLNEDAPVIRVPAASPDETPTTQLNFTSGDQWFIATRSAFGIRPDGNLVFAVGHHISTCDLAKALVLAGCVRALHGDANPGNCVGVLCLTDKEGNIVKRVGLSPGQDKATLDRYLKGAYPKDFFAFLRR